MSVDVEKQLVSRLTRSFAFSLQLDESTDVSGLPVLLVFVRYLLQNKVEEDVNLLNVERLEKKCLIS